MGQAVEDFRKGRGGLVFVCPIMTNHSCRERQRTSENTSGRRPAANTVTLPEIGICKAGVQGNMRHVRASLSWRLHLLPTGICAASGHGHVGLAHHRLLPMNGRRGDRSRIAGFFGMRLLGSSRTPWSRSRRSQGALGDPRQFDGFGTVAAARCRHFSAAAGDV